MDNGIPIIAPIIVTVNATPIINTISPINTAISLPVTFIIPSTSFPIAINGANNIFNKIPPPILILLYLYLYHFNSVLNNFI